MINKFRGNYINAVQTVFPDVKFEHAAFGKCM